MEIKTLDLNNERLVIEALAIHCAYPLEMDQSADLTAFCVPESLTKLDAHFSKTILYMHDHGRIVAMHWLEIPTRRKGFARSLWVDPAYRRKGYARQLKTVGEQWFVAHNVSEIESSVLPENKPMVALNQSLGFVKAGSSWVKTLSKAPSYLKTFYS
jgi:GNAT superfamily N-acetyltransferase